MAGPASGAVHQDADADALRGSAVLRGEVPREVHGRRWRRLSFPRDPVVLFVWHFSAVHFPHDVRWTSFGSSFSTSEICGLRDIAIHFCVHKVPPPPWHVAEPANYYLGF